jgi:hypothetical protein
MPVTSIDLSKNVLDFMDNLISHGFARSRREIVLGALESYERYSIHKWRNSIIVLHGLVHGLVSKRSIAQLVAGLSEEELYERGGMMSQSLRDAAMVEYGKDLSKPENHQLGLQMLETAGWGEFTAEGNRIMIREPLFPKQMLHGYLESALGVKLSLADTFEDVVIMTVSRAVPPIQEPTKPS